MDTLKNVTTVAQMKLTAVLQNPYIMAVLKLALILYAAQIAPRLPTQVQSTFKNTFFKIAAISLIAYLADIDFQLAIILAVIFVLSANLLSGRSMFESYHNVHEPQVGTFYTDLKKYTDLLGKPAAVGHAHLIESLSDNYPGCNNVTIDDLLNLFDGDHIKLQNTVEYAFNELLQALPAGSDAKTRLTQIAHAVGLPYSLKLTDENAPYLSTILLQHGFRVSDTCQVPH